MRPPGEGAIGRHIRLGNTTHTGRPGRLDLGDVRLKIASCLAAAVLFLAAPAAALPMLVVEFGGTTAAGRVPIGGTLEITVRAVEIPAGAPGSAGQTGLFGYGFALLFDATALSVATPPGDASGFNAATRVSLPGIVGATANRFLLPGDGPTGELVLASFALTADRRGVFTLQLTGFHHDLDGQPTGGDNVLYDGTELDASLSPFFTSALVEVPEPAGAGLLATGLLMALPRRR